MHGWVGGQNKEEQREERRKRKVNKYREIYGLQFEKSLCNHSFKSNFLPSRVIKVGGEKLKKNRPPSFSENEEDVPKE